MVTTFADGDGGTRSAGTASTAARSTRTTRRGRAVSAEVDPARVLLLDVNYTNNSRTLEPRAGEAGLKWGLKWMAWLQELMLTYAFFV